MLFLVWLAAAFVVVGFINLYLRYFGLPRATNGTPINGSSYSRSLCTGEGAGVCGDTGGGWLRRSKSDVDGEPVAWLTSSVAWLHHKCSQTPDFVDAWLRALTQEAERQQLQQQTGVLPTFSSQVQLRFDGVHGPPPEFSGIKADTSSGEQLTLVASVTGKEIVLQFCCFLTNPLTNTAPSTPPPVSEVVNCDARILWIKGKIKLVVKLINNELSLSVSFLQPPDVRIQVKPIRANSQIDTASVESMVRSALSTATTTISWTSTRSQPHPSSQNSPHLFTRSMHDPSGIVQENNLTPPMRAQSLYKNREPLLTSAQNQAAYHSQLNSQSPPTSPVSSSYMTSSLHQLPGVQQQLLQEKGMQGANSLTQPKLLAKIIKANGLVDTEWGSCNAYCLAKLDHPAQSFMTNVIRNTVNPLWDEQHVFDINAQSKTIQFEVLDRDKAPDNDLLGRATVLLDEIRRMPSNRQIIPLTGRPHSRTSTSGSVTVELIFLDASTQRAALQQGVAAMQQPNSSTSPLQQQLQQQQLQQQKLYGAGATVGLQDVKAGQYYTGSQSGGISNLSAHDLALTSQHPGSPRSPEAQPTFVVTGAEPLQSHTLQANQGLGGYRSPADLNKGKADKKDGFAATLRKKFALKKGSRSQSVDRYQSSSLRETSYLRPPPSHPPNMTALPAYDDTHIQYGDSKRNRSNSFGSSIKNIFRKDKKGASRDNSLNRPTPTGAVSTGTQGGLTRYQREGTPAPPGRQEIGSTVVSSASIPSNTPLREY